MNLVRFALLGSGSQGNALLVEADDTRLLLDCGFSAGETVRRLARLGLAPEQLTAVLVTHEHDDHLGGVARLARKFALPVWATPGTTARPGRVARRPRGASDRRLRVPVHRGDRSAAFPRAA